MEWGRARDLDRGELAAQASELYGAGSAAEPVPPDLECAWVREGGALQARAAIGVAHDLAGARGATGWIGWYEAREASAGSVVLGEACARLAERGAARVLAPFHGSTWHRYRLALASEPGDPLADPPFFLGEPRNPFSYPEHFAKAGFAVATAYESRVVSAGGPEAAAPPGVSVRTLDESRFDAELGRIGALSLDAFADNAYYSPISLEEFRAQYEPLRRLLDPALVLLAENPAEELIGYILSYADTVDRRRLVAKTMAVARSSRGIGLGAYLLEEVGRRAARRGYEQVIHALMHQENRSQRLSSRQGARLFRRYALYQWTP